MLPYYCSLPKLDPGDLLSAGPLGILGPGSRARRLQGPTHPEDIRIDAKLSKQAHSVLRSFPSLEPDKILKGPDASLVVLGVLMEAQKAAEEEIDEEALDLPGVPEDAAIEELPAMKVADVRGCVEAIAAHVSLDPDELLELATYEADRKARSAAHKKEDM